MGKGGEGRGEEGRGDGGGQGRGQQLKQGDGRKEGSWVDGVGGNAG